MPLQEAAKPFYEPLGIVVERTEPRFWFSVQGVPIAYRACELIGIGALLTLCPNFEHWRLHFPKSGRRAIDTSAAAGALIAQCYEKGVYVPAKA